MHRQSPLGPVDPSFRALPGRLKFTVRRHKCNKDFLSAGGVGRVGQRQVAARHRQVFFFFLTLVTGPRRSLSLKLRDTRVDEPQIRARLRSSGTDEERSAGTLGRRPIPLSPPAKGTGGRAGTDEAVRAPPYRGTSLIRNCPPLGPYSRTMPRALWKSQGGGGFL